LDKREFIKQIQEVCIVESIDHDIKLLATSDINNFKNSELDDLAKLLQSCDHKTKEIIKKLIYFTSRNYISALLHLIDMQFTLEENTDELMKTDLLDLFLHTKG